MSKPWRRALVALASFALALTACELALRATGAGNVTPPTLQFGWPDPETLDSHYAPDDDLFWVTKDYAEELESAVRARPQWVLMGCSCTEFSDYDARFAKLLEESHPGNALRYVNLGVGGWTTFQGRRQLERDVLALQPRVVTVFFGWNDHWESFGHEDEVLGRATVQTGLGRLRIAQLARRWLEGRGRVDGRPKRVPLERFRKNLTAIVQGIQTAGAVPVLMTAPSAHVQGQEPAYLAERHLEDLGELVPLHRAYADAVRQVAREQEVGLVDLAEAFEAFPPQRVKNEYFYKDGIHLRDRGSQRVAETLYALLEEEGLLPLFVQ